MKIHDPSKCKFCRACAGTDRICKKAAIQMIKQAGQVGIQAAKIVNRLVLEQMGIKK